MKRLLAISIFLALALQAGPTWANMYKCIDSKGRTTYQGSPCAGQAKSNSGVEIKVRVTGAPLKRTPSNRRYLAQYTAYQTQKVIVDACVSKNSQFAKQVSAAHDKYYEYAKENIERGEEILKRGFRDFSSGEMRTVQQEAREEQKIELRVMSRFALDQTCSAQAGRFERMLGGKIDKPSGYQKNVAGTKKSN